MTGGDLMALKVCFNLPSGAYATIALRELTGFDLGKKSMKVWSYFSHFVKSARVATVFFYYVTTVTNKCIVELQK